MSKDLDDLIKVCKKIKVKLIVDIVLNHTSDQHEWFKKAISGDKKYIHYYNFYKEIPNEWKSVLPFQISSLFYQINKIKYSIR